MKKIGRFKVSKYQRFKVLKIQVLTPHIISLKAALIAQVIAIAGFYWTVSILSDKRELLG